MLAKWLARVTQAPRGTESERRALRPGRLEGGKFVVVDFLFVVAGKERNRRRRRRRKKKRRRLKVFAASALLPNLLIVTQLDCACSGIHVIY